VDRTLEANWRFGEAVLRNGSDESVSLRERNAVLFRAALSPSSGPSYEVAPA
jgi:hypothetical protein